MQFLKKHYEKIILCAVLLGLAAAAVWMGGAMQDIKNDEVISTAASKGKPLAPLDLTADMQTLAQVTNPPPVVLSGEHNLFNPVTWKRKPNGELLKILKTGPDALTIVNITPLYTIITYNHPSSGGVYVIDTQQHSGRKVVEYVKKDEKKKSSLFVLKAVKGSVDDPTDLQLEINDTQEKVWISKTNAYKAVDGYLADLKYDPESRSFSKVKVNDPLTLDNEPYKIVDITNNLVRVQSINNTKMTTIRWSGNP